MDPSDLHMLSDIASRLDQHKVLDIDNEYPAPSARTTLLPDDTVKSRLRPSPHNRASSLSSASSDRVACSHKSSFNQDSLLNSDRVSHFLAHVGRKRRFRVQKNTDLGPFRSRFGSAQYGVATTIFDLPQFLKSDAFGVYVLFWLGTSFTMLRSIARHFAMDSKTSILDWPVVRILLTDIVWVALTDLAMYLSIYVAFFIQAAIRRGYFSWSYTGYGLQSLYTPAFFVFWLVFASGSWMAFPWIARVFLVLHSLVLVMKMHLYAMYNGYLWNLFYEYEFSVSYLAKIESSSDATVPTPHEREKVVRMLKDHIRFCEFELEHQATVTAVEGAGTESVVAFPQNITWHNYFEYSMFPTVVYTLAFPRTKGIRWNYVLLKVLGIFGIMFLMILVADRWIYPLVLECLELRKLPLRDRFLPFVFVLLDIIPPFMMEYLFTFFVIWDAILNAIAELSRYADREFYGPWWACTDWLEFSRIWNVPVHKFLLRHVYHSSISACELDKMSASLVTFVISSIVHEVVMYVLYGKVRGYLLVLQMSQLPLVALSRTRFMRGRKILNNALCWFGLIAGPGVVCMLYLVF